MKIKFLPLAFLLLATPALFAQDYEIRLARANKPGDQLNLSATGKLSMDSTQTLGDAAPKEQKQDITVQFEGVEKIVEVDAKGKETKITLTVDKLTQTVGSETTDVAPKGTVITCSVSGKKQNYEIDGKAADPGVAQALDVVIQLSRGEPSDDEIFGTKEHKKKGDSWDINADLAKSSLAGQTGGGEVSDLSGKTTLDDVAGDNLKVSALMKGKAKPPLPPQIIVDDSSFDAKFTGTFPIDVTKPPVEEGEEVTFAFTAHADTPKGKNGHQIDGHSIPSHQDHAREINAAPARRAARQMQVRGIRQIGETAIALECRAMEMEHHVVVLRHLDVAPDEQMLALCAPAQFIQRPPLLEGIVLLEQLQLSTIGERQKAHTSPRECARAPMYSNKKRSVQSEVLARLAVESASIALKPVR